MLFGDRHPVAVSVGPHGSSFASLSDPLLAAPQRGASPSRRTGETRSAESYFLLGQLYRSETSVLYSRRRDSENANPRLVLFSQRR